MAFILFFCGWSPCSYSQDKRPRERGIEVGVLKPGNYNAIIDVQSVRVGHVTLKKGGEVRTGVTAILPHPGNIFQEKVTGAIHVGNGFGKLAGSTQVRELGNIETPVILTNTLAVPTAADALIDHALSFKANREVQSINPVVGETNDGWLNDIQGRHVKKKHVLKAIESAKGGKVEEGNLGAGTGTMCFGFKGGIGTSSRVLPEERGGYSVGVLVQTNFGGVLQIAGAPVGKELNRHYMSDELNDDPNGSCMIVLATDAPVDSRNLERMAKRAMLGMARTGGISSNGSGDYVVAFSTAEELRIPYRKEDRFNSGKVLRNDAMSPLFMATIEATEEAILNSLFAAEDMKGRDGRTVEALPVNRVMKILERYNVVK
ncbi:MAG: P1 family peptidase, partial [Bacteroidales bacterium]|nr:P1 family peptidase [Bacteroidales bacterium]